MVTLKLNIYQYRNKVTTSLKTSIAASVTTSLTASVAKTETDATVFILNWESIFCGELGGGRAYFVPTMFIFSQLWK